MSPSNSRTKALSVSPRASGTGCGGVIGAIFMSIFFSLFMIAGSLVLWKGMFEPLTNAFAATSWKATPCVITSSEVAGQKTYTIDIKYDYEFDGQPFSGNQYSFQNLKTSAKSGKEKIVQQFPPGTKTICYVNPDAPGVSVIKRTPDLNVLWGLFGLPFFLVGVGGLYYLRFGKKKYISGAESPAADEFNNGRDFSDRDSVSAQVPNRSYSNASQYDFGESSRREQLEPVKLEAGATPMGSFLVTLVIGLIWNGIVLAICMFRAPDWFQGKWNWLPELIILPFMLIGFLLIFAAFYAFLGLFNPVPVLTLSRRTIPLGGMASLKWKFKGSANSIRLIQISLKGIEEAKYTRGTNHYTDTAVFFDQVLFETQETQTIGNGEVEILIPSDTMHSFQALKNNVKWQVHFRGDIPWWPDVKSEFSIVVVPHE